MNTTKPSRDRLPAAIRALKEALGWTDAQLARSLAVSRSSVTKWAAGSVRPGPGALVGLYDLAQGTNAALDIGAFVATGVGAWRGDLEIACTARDFVAGVNSVLLGELMKPSKEASDRAAVLGRAINKLAEADEYLQRRIAMMRGSEEHDK